MPQMTGGEALARSLYREGVRVIFGLPGIQMYGIMSALREEPRIRFIVTRHEQATAYMADGYSRAGGGIGTALVVPGPGLLNASAALATAYSASSPVLIVSGQIQKANIGKNIGVIHEVNDQQDLIKPVTKWRRRAMEVSEIPPAVHEAVRQLKTGRPRPVEIEIPWETFEVTGEAELLEPANPTRPAAPAPDVAKAVDMLAAARNPVIYAGGGVNLGNAHEQLAALARFLQAGVVQSAEGRGALSDHDPLSLGAGMYPGNPVLEYLQAADVVLAVGTRLVRSGVREGQQIIQIDIDGEEIGRNYGNTFGLVGDAAATLSALLEGLEASGGPRASRTQQLNEMKAVRDADGQKTQPQGGIVASLRAGAPEDTIHVTGMTQIGYYSRVWWPVYHPRSYFTSGYSGNLGYAYPVGLGAKVACPDRPVLVSSGDGGFLFNSQEIATAVQHKINVVAVVFNDNAFGNVSRDLDMDWGGTYGAELHNPDFVRMAEAYGAVGLRVNEPDRVGEAVADAIQLDRPVVIDVPVGRMPRPSFFPRRPQREAAARG